MTLVFPLTFALQANAQIVSSEPMKAEINKLFETTPLVEKYNDGELVKKELKFSAAIGLGSGYKFGLKGRGILKDYNNSSSFFARIGYKPCKYAEVQGEYENISGFKRTTSLPSWKDTSIIGFSVYNINLKLLIPLEIKGINFFPYVIGGAGKAKTEYSISWEEPGQQQFPYKIKLSGSGNHSKIGWGVDVKLYGNLLFFSELNYQELKWDEEEYDLYFSQMIGGLSYKF